MERVDRRVFLQRMGLAAVGTAAFGPVIFFPDTIDKAKRLEYKFGTIISGDWDQERLDLLDQLLSYLPRHFYGQDGWWVWPRKAEFKIDRNMKPKDPYFQAACLCGFLGKEKVDTVLMSPDVFPPEHVRTAFYTLVHELTHRIVPLNLDPELIGTPKGRMRFNRLSQEDMLKASIWFRVLDDITKTGLDGENTLSVKHQQPLDQVAINTLLKMAEKYNVELDHISSSHNPTAPEMLSGDDRLNFELYKNFRIGLRHIEELVADLGAMYAFGRDFFYEMYGQFFSENQVNRLYKFAKFKIFENKEYGPFLL